MSALLQVIVLIGCFTYILCGRVLLLSHQYGSHLILSHAIAEQLPKKGHDVYTVLGTNVKEPPVIKANGYKVLRFHRPDNDPLLDMDGIVAKQVVALFKGEMDATGPSLFSYRECELIMDDKKFIQQVKDLKFDIAVVDHFVVSYCLPILPYSLGIPYVMVSAAIEEFIMRTPQPASFIPNVIMENSEHMNFIDRFKTLIVNSVMAIPAIQPFVAMRNTTLLKKYVNNPQIQQWTDLPRHASLFFICVGSVAESPAPLMPNIINVEGLTAKPAGPLNPEFEALVSTAAHGIVVVSFGSGVRNLPQEVLHKMLDAFGQRKELFFWRIQLAKEIGFIVPKNVLVFKWLPQNDLLGHEKIRLFITHSGNNGRYESIYHGVPMIAFPIFGDQPHNAHMIAKKGYGIAMKLQRFSVAELVENMGKILDSTKYHDQIRTASKILKSRPGGSETAAFWMEHVMEFGDSHLRNDAAISMPYYQFVMWDIYGFFMAIFILIILIVIRIMKYIITLFTGVSTKEKHE